uniref:Uncharacterized protein n=1 Tax=Ditylum brightwellii TaxID=49249 RepID=A0A6V2BY41_9STRA|mmetsp:Transcript_6861/g.9069  ORF Transcript_6861/g.9069 Transcript_6861/m.9069 type:complete len:222 (+) Transcript_6861:333-998(+)
MKSKHQTPPPPTNTTQSPTIFQKVMFWTLLPSILLIPLWLFAGRTLFGGPSGWIGITYMFTICPALFLCHLLIFLVCLCKNRRCGKGCSATYHVSYPLAMALVVYDTTLFLQQFVMNDGGDTGPSGSWASHHLGLSVAVSTKMDALLTICIFFLLFVIMFLTFTMELEGDYGVGQEALMAPLVTEEHKVDGEEDSVVKDSSSTLGVHSTEENVSQVEICFV